MTKLLSVNNLNYAYDTNLIFKNVNFSIEQNSINVVIGPNNCGKTTLIKLLSGVLPIQDGLFFENNTINKKNFRQYSLLIGVMICNNKNVFLFDEVIPELVFSMENLNYTKLQINKRLKEIIDIFEMDSFVNKKIKNLTGLEKTKLLLAISLMHKPKIVFLDNIFDDISFDEYKKLINILREIIADEDLTILYTTNNMNNIILCDQVIVLGNKQVFLSDSVDKILEHDNEIVKLGIEIPTMIDLSLKLKFYQLLDTIEMNVEGLVDRLWK